MAKGKTKAHKAAGKKKEIRRAKKKALVHAMKKTAGHAKPHAKSAKTGKPRAPKRERVDPSIKLPDVAIPENVIKDLQDKKELLIHPDFTSHLVRRYLRKQPKLIPELHKPHFMRSAGYDGLKKWVRQELRVLVGMFVLEPGLKKLEEAPTAQILESHLSTSERAPYYAGLYDVLFGGEKPEVILDICAGLNPCSYEYLGCAPVYYAVDVSPQLMEFVQHWFARKGIVGKAWSCDVTAMTEFPEADTVFIFKGTDVLERVHYGYGEILLDALRHTRIIISFSTQTVSGSRDIDLNKRAWVERWAESRGKTVRMHDIPGERFYILE